VFTGTHAALEDHRTPLGVVPLLNLGCNCTYGTLVYMPVSTFKVVAGGSTVRVSVPPPQLSISGNNKPVPAM
jgi:hypothetical protein